MERIEHDTRLTDLINGQYRILHDGQKILIPVGMSTTRPLTTENVLANLKIYGTINQSYFMPPWVDYINSEVNTKRFDRYQLGVWRPNEPDENFPIDKHEIDYHDDLGLTTIHTNVDFHFAESDEVFGTPYGEYKGTAKFEYLDGKTWVSEQLHFDLFGLVKVYGNFFLVTNPNTEHTAKGKSFSTGTFIQEVNLPVTAIVTEAYYKNGNSIMPLLLHNTVEFPLYLARAIIDVKGGE